MTSVRSVELMDEVEAGSTSTNAPASSWAMPSALVVLAGVGVCLVGCGPAAVSQEFGGVFGDVEFYKGYSNKFVGLNPRKDYGSGFYATEAAWKAETWGNAPATNGVPPAKTRTDLCTCDCDSSADGVGCVGYGGITFRYLSLLAAEGRNAGQWRGQMVAMDCGSAKGGKCNNTDPDQTYFEFVGEDIRESPGGAAIYSVATSLKFSGDAISGLFRQANDPVSCKAGMKDEVDYMAGTVERAESCYAKCGSDGQYAAWLAYCKATNDDSAGTGFSGWGV